MKLYPILKRVFFKQPGESRLVDSGLFVAIFAVLAPLLFIAFNASGALPGIAANSASALSPLFGLTTEVVQLDGGYPHLAGMANGQFFDAEINLLCGGTVELAVLIALVFATRDRSLRQRVLGTLVGVAALLAFNPLRIVLTLKLFGSPSFVLAHDFLFRASIVVIVVGAYALWYLGLSRRPRKK